MGDLPAYINYTIGHYRKMGRINNGAENFVLQVVFPFYVPLPCFQSVLALHMVFYAGNKDEYIVKTKRRLQGEVLYEPEIMDATLFKAGWHGWGFRKVIIEA